MSEARPSLVYIDSWGMKGMDPGQLDQPRSIATDSLGNSYIADTGSGFIHKFSYSGTPLLAFQDPALAHPQSVAVDRGGAIYVTDPSHGSVFVFLPTGDRYGVIHLPGRPNSENVLKVTVDDDGVIYVLDTNAGKIFSYTSRFRLIRTWQLGGKSSLAGDAENIANGSDGYIYTLDPRGNRIVRCTGDGRKSAEISASSDGIIRKLSDQFAVSNKRILAMDADGRMLHAWTTDGKLILDADLAPQLGQGSRYAPAIAMDSRNQLLVLDDREARVLRYRINF